MNKKLIYSLCAASFLITACDYNEDNFPGFDQEPLTDVIYYEGDFTGKYPTEGYFSIVQGNEDAGKETIEKALISMLEDTYPYCDKGSSAKIKVKVADVMPEQMEEPAFDDKYTLQKEDYDAMGTGKGQPGEHDNFSSTAKPNDYLPAFCATKFADKAEGIVMKVTYVYYSGKAVNEYKFYKKVQTMCGKKNPCSTLLTRTMNSPMMIMPLWELKQASLGRVIHLHLLPKPIVSCRYSCRINMCMLLQPV